MMLQHEDLALQGKSKVKQHWLFGYGSLMSHDSRLRFTNIDADAIPVQVQGWQRSWSMCCPIENFTCVGGVPVNLAPEESIPQNSAVGGVIVPIDAITDTLRKREQNYHFVALAKQDIKHFFAHQQEALHVLLEGGIIWICQVNAPGVSNADYPVYQSYVDTCLAGCLESGGEEFARKFILETGRWDSYWVNDRQVPQYPRAARIGKVLQSGIDELLQQFDLLRFRQG